MKNKDLEQFIKDIQYKNRNPSDHKILEQLRDKATNTIYRLRENQILYRARVIESRDSINTEAGFYGFPSGQCLAPPPHLTRDLRANYRFIPYLYCADDPYVSILETRPSFSDHVSVAELRVKKDLTVLDFSRQYGIVKVQGEPYRSVKMTNKKADLFEELSALFSKPVSQRDDVVTYIPTQYIAEYVKNLGYDGIAYKSSLLTEDNIPDRHSVMKEAVPCNIVIFNHCDGVEAVCSNVYKITNIQFDCKQIDDGGKQKNICNPMNAIMERIKKLEQKAPPNVR